MDDYYINLECAISDLEDAFYPLDNVKNSLPKESNHYKRVLQAIEELESCHDEMSKELEAYEGV